MTDMPKCPKCRKQDYDLTVVCEEETFTVVTDGICNFQGASSLPQPVRAYGDCRKCGHKWQIKHASTAQLNNF